MSALHINESTFEEEVMKSDLPVLLDFYADWCGPCKMMSPVIDQLAGELEGKAKVCKINVDECQNLAGQFKVSSIPTLAVMKEGKVVAMNVGARPKAELLKMLGF